MLDQTSLEILNKIDNCIVVEKSEIISNNYIKLLKYLEEISYPLKKVIYKLLNDPFPDFAVNCLYTEIEEVLLRGKTLDNRKLLFKIAPGSSFDSHNNFPGGLIIHTLTNIELAIDNIESFKKIYPKLTIDRDNIVAAFLMHDIMKSWIMTWKDDFTSYPDINVEGHKLHHLLIIAQAINDGLDNKLIKIIASIHYHPIKEKIQIYDAIKIATKLVQNRKIYIDETLSIEQWIGYSTEHQSRDLLLYCNKIIQEEIKESLKRIFNNEITDLNINAIRNIILSLETDLQLYDYLVTHEKNNFDKKIFDLLSKIIHTF